MASLKEVRTRIESVNSTKQITSAMKMVAASKLRKSQNAILALRPFANKFSEIMRNISQDIDISKGNVYTEIREINRVLIIPLTSNKGLCGVFNANIIRDTIALIHEEYQIQLDNNQLDILCIRTDIKETELKITEAMTELRLTCENNEYVKANIASITDKIPALAEAAITWQRNKGDDVQIGKISEFSVSASRHKNGSTFLILSRGGINYHMESGNSLTGNIKRINNFFAKFDKQIEAKEHTLNELKKKKLELVEQLEYSSNIVDTIKRLESELRHIFAELSVKQDEAA